MKAPESEARTAEKPGHDEWLETVKKLVGSLRFGVVQIVVHDAQVVQIERTEKVRLDRKPTDS